MSTQAPNAEQLIYLQSDGLIDPITGDISLTNPNCVDELTRMVEEGQAYLVGSNIVGISCSQHDVIDVFAQHPDRFGGNIVDGPKASISPYLELFGCAIIDAAVLGDTRVTGGVYTGGMTYSSEKDRPKPIIEVAISDEHKIVVDPNLHKLTYNGHVIAATYMEFEIMTILATNVGRAVHRNEIHTRLWAGVGDSGVVDVHLSKLRNKLVAAGLKNPFKTIRSVGFTVNIDKQ